MDQKPWGMAASLAFGLFPYGDGELFREIEDDGEAVGEQRRDHKDQEELGFGVEPYTDQGVYDENAAGGAQGMGCGREERELGRLIVKECLEGRLSPRIVVGKINRVLENSISRRLSLSTIDEKGIEM
ncbi:hypothetical protein V6N13_093562 [Hibiscus sabdariffa]|uniref:Uncharacterized protein n=2 Tax=Hibiscus sabdariffa TaxID=183260 RepID=A0ABR2NFZ0_9ROSI